jgi:hypothetical protein
LDFSIFSVSFHNIVLFFLRVHNFLLLLGNDVVDLQLQPSRLRHQHYRLLVHPAHQVHRRLGYPVHGHLKRVRLNALLNHLPYLGSGSIVYVRGTETVQRLVLTLEIIMLHPQPHALLEVFQVTECRLCQKILFDGLPEPLNFALRLWMVRP